MSNVDAVVLVGGKGTRLRPLTLSTPKPMLPAAGVPFLAHLFSRIRAAGIGHVVLGTSYKAEVFAEYFGDGAELGLRIDYVVEDEPLDTGGAIRNVAGELRGEHAMVFNGDILSGVDLRAVAGTHFGAAADATLHLVKVDDPRAFGCVPTDPSGRVTAFLEKSDNPPTDQVNAGCYMFHRSVIEDIPTGRPVSVERETFPGLLRSGAHLHAHVDSSYWLDLGTPQAFVQGSADLVRGLAPTAALAGGPGQHQVSAGASVADDAALSGGTAVGAECTISSGAAVESSVLMAGARIDAGARIARSVIGAGAVIGAGTVVRDAVVGDRAVIGSGCELAEGMRVWPDVRIPDGGVRFSTDA